MAVRPFALGLVLALTAPAQSPQEAAIAKQRQSVSVQLQTVRRQVKDTKTNPFFATPWTAESSLAAATAAPADDCQPAARATLDPAVAEAARKNALTPNLLRAVIQRESAWNPCAVSSQGAMGLMQIMPATAASLGLTDPFDPFDNIEAGSRYLRELLDRFGGNLPKALAGYNAGPARVDAAGGIPPIKETQDYVREIVRQMQ